MLMHHIQHTLVTETAATPFILLMFPSPQNNVNHQCRSVGDTTGLHHLSMNFTNNCIMPCYPCQEVSQQTGI